MTSTIIHRDIYQVKLRCNGATPKLVAAAIHEASHGVLSLAIGFRVSELSIYPDGTGRAVTMRGQRIHNSEESALFAAAGMAGEKRYSMMPRSDARFDGDIDSIMDTYPDATWDDIDDIEARAAGILEQWQGAIDALAVALLDKRTLGHEDIEAIVSKTPYGKSLATRWCAYEQPRSSATSLAPFSREAAITALQDILRRRKAGETLPANLASAVSKLEAVQAARGGGAPAGIRYSDGIPLKPSTQKEMYTRQPVNYYEHRALVPTVDNHEYRRPR